MGTSIPCRDETRDRLREVRGDDFRSWDEFLVALADVYEQTDEVEETPPGGPEITEADADQLAQIREELEKIPQRTADELEGRFR